MSKCSVFIAVFLFANISLSMDSPGFFWKKTHTKEERNAERKKRHEAHRDAIRKKWNIPRSSSSQKRAKVYALPNDNDASLEIIARRIKERECRRAQKRRALCRSRSKWEKFMAFCFGED